MRSPIARWIVIGTPGDITREDRKRVEAFKRHHQIGNCCWALIVHNTEKRAAIIAELKADANRHVVAAARHVYPSATDKKFLSWVGWVQQPAFPSAGCGCTRCDYAREQRRRQREEL